MKDFVFWPYKFYLCSWFQGTSSCEKGKMCDNKSCISLDFTSSAKVLLPGPRLSIFFLKLFLRILKKYGYIYHISLEKILFKYICNNKVPSFLFSLIIYPVTYAIVYLCMIRCPQCSADAHFAATASCPSHRAMFDHQLLCHCLLFKLELCCVETAHSGLVTSSDSIIQKSPPNNVNLYPRCIIGIIRTAEFTSCQHIYGFYEEVQICDDWVAA